METSIMRPRPVVRDSTKAAQIARARVNAADRVAHRITGAQRRGLRIARDAHDAGNPLNYLVIRRLKG